MSLWTNFLKLIGDTNMALHPMLPADEIASWPTPVTEAGETKPFPQGVWGLWVLSRYGSDDVFEKNIFVFNDEQKARGYADLLNQKVMAEGGHHVFKVEFVETYGIFGVKVA